MAVHKTHIDLYYGQMTQVEVGTSFPTTREEPMYIAGTDDGLDDGDMYFVTGTGVLGIRVGATWQMIEFTEP